MKIQNKAGKNAFTLVELIVVITILAILGTIAFISLTGYNKEAKNGKVISDLRNIASAIEVARTRNSRSLISMVGNPSTVNTIDDSNLVNNGSMSIGGAGVNYLVGNINFSAINQNGVAFKDPNSFNQQQEYIYGAVNSENFAYYQMAGHIVEEDIIKTRVIGTYAPINVSVDTIGILSTQENDTPIGDGMVITGDLYQ